MHHISQQHPILQPGLRSGPPLGPPQIQKSIDASNNVGVEPITVTDSHSISNTQEQQPNSIGSKNGVSSEMVGDHSVSGTTFNNISTTLTKDIAELSIDRRAPPVSSESKLNEQTNTVPSLGISNNDLDASPLHSNASNLHVSPRTQSSLGSVVGSAAPGPTPSYASTSPSVPGSIVSSGTNASVSGSNSSNSFVSRSIDSATFGGPAIPNMSVSQPPNIGFQGFSGPHAPIHPVSSPSDPRMFSSVQNMQTIASPTMGPVPSPSIGSMYSPGAPPMPSHSAPSMSGFSAPPMHSPSAPSMPGHGVHPMIGPSVPAVSGPGVPPTPGPGMTPMPVPGMPPMTGPGMPPMTGPGMPPMTGPGMPPMPGHGIPPMTGPGMPPMPGPGMPYMPGPGMPPMPGPGMPPMTGPGMPPMTGPGMPPMPSPGMPSMLSPGIPAVPGPNAGNSPGMTPQSGRFLPPGSLNRPSPGIGMHSMGPNMSTTSTNSVSGQAPLTPGMPPPVSGMSSSPGHTFGIPRTGIPSSMSLNSVPPGIPPTGSHPANLPMSPGMPPLPNSNLPPPGSLSQNTPSFGMPPISANSGQPSPLSSYRPGAPPPTTAIAPGSQGLPSGGSPYPGGMPPPGTMGLPPTSPAPPLATQQMQNRYPGGSMQGGNMANYPPSQPGSNVANYPPGQGGNMSNYPQSQGRRLNPDDMPSPMQVMEEDQQSRSGDFITNLKGAVPPLVTTNFTVQDGGNASPHFMRSSMYSVPALPDMMKQCSIPFGLVISPMADHQPDENPIYLGTSLEKGPVRCTRCKAYMSPLMMFTEGGRRFQCLLCKHVSEVAADYFCHMDGLGARADKFQRPELCLGTYEFLATSEYCKEKMLPKEPAFIFVIEISQLMMQRGIVNLLCQNMRSILENLPKEDIPGEEDAPSKIHVGFITYDSSVHFYKMNGKEPEMCVVCDKNDMFVPVPDGILCDFNQLSENLEKLMCCIPQNFHSTRETSGALAGAVQAGMAALKASGRTGKLFVFHSSLPQGDDNGRLKNREDRKVLGTEKEKSVLSPQNTFYNNLAQDMVNVGCGMDLFFFNDSYIDLATVGQLTKLTGGQCYKYSLFQLNKDGPRLLKDLKLNLKRNIAFDAMMRVRTSTGIRPVDFFGHFYMTNTHDIELATIDSSKAIAIEIKHDDKISEEDGVYLQAALLYTSVSGQRKLRIMNLSLNLCYQMSDLYKNCDLDTLMNFFTKQSMFKFLENSAKQVKDHLITKTAHILACYRKNCATPSSAGQLILPELMKLLPLYSNCLSKCDALNGGQDLTCDERSWHIYQLSTMSVAASVAYLYPRLIPLSDADPEGVDIPAPLRASYDKLRPDSVFLLENGLFAFMWVGSGTTSTWMKDVFGVSAPHQLDPVLAELPDLDNDTSKRVRNILDAVRKHRRLHLRLFVVPQQGKHEVVMRNYLVEDKGIYGSPSYVDFLCHVHKEIRSLLS